MAHVSALYVYPIKACRGIRVAEWAVERRGFFADRRWMIVDADGNFVTQREVSRLSLVDTSVDSDLLSVSAPGFSRLILPLTHSAEPRTVRVWEDQVSACAHREGSAWFSELLGAPHELVYMADTEHRPVNPARARAGDIVSFADGYPFLLISEASLEDLNARLDEPIGMERFRPNIVISGTEPFAEDGYSEVWLGPISFRGAKRCDRCVVTTIDPLTGESGREPLRTLAKYRLEDQKVWFGMNLIHDGTGVLRVGDPVTRLATA
ncbi:MAG TPA: MOSC N-terminal beta barrel domain-containing protein [Polyangiaceae bacterium]